MRNLWFLVFTLFQLLIRAQDVATISFIVTETQEHLQKSTFKLKDTLNLKKICSERLDRYIEQGHPLASVDSISGHWTTGYTAHIYLGPKMKHLKILPQNEETSALIRAVPGINEKFLTQVPLTNKDVSLLRKRLLKYLEDNGYPFAKLHFEQLTFAEEPAVNLRIETGSLVQWSKIHIKGDLKLSRNFILTLLEIKEGDAYNEEKFQKATQRLTQVSFISMTQAPQVAFFPEGAELFLYLTKRESSAANGILGMQPNPEGKIVFTGDIQLKLENTLGIGEQIHLVWKNLMPQTPQLNVGATLPFLFKTKFGTEAKFHLYKRDSSFLEVKGNFGLRYFLGNNSFVRGFYNFENSSILGGAANNPLFSDGLSVRINGYGLGFERQTLDYFPNPRQGFKMDVQTIFGTRQTLPSDANGLTVQGTKNNIFRGTFKGDYFIPFGKRSTVRLGALAQFYYADTIYTNEQLRFGGLQTLRGFDEESLLATTLSRLTAEYRFLLDQNSHLLVFFDQGFYENRSRAYMRDTPFGFGAGLSFGTKAGVFSIIYGLGSQRGNPINLRDGKIHIGYFAVF